MSKMDMLRKEGLVLISIETIKPIIDLKKKEKVDKDLYELLAGSIRIGTYFHREKNTFVYLWGWRKGKQIQSSDVDKCRRLLHEYLEEKQE